jgi:hypothetical protein
MMVTSLGGFLESGTHITSNTRVSVLVVPSSLAAIEKRSHGAVAQLSSL